MNDPARLDTHGADLYDCPGFDWPDDRRSVEFAAICLLLGLAFAGAIVGWWALT